MYKTLWCPYCLRMTTHGQYEPKGLWYCTNEIEHGASRASPEKGKPVMRPLAPPENRLPR